MTFLFFHSFYNVFLSLSHLIKKVSSTKSYPTTESIKDTLNPENQDTPTNTYTVTVLCSNCYRTPIILIPKKEKINLDKIHTTPCEYCETTSLHFAVWDGHKYVIKEGFWD